MISCAKCGTKYEDYATYCNQCDLPLANNDGKLLEEKQVSDDLASLEQYLKVASTIHKILFWLYVVAFIGLSWLHVTTTLHVWQAYFLPLIPLVLGLVHFQTYRGLEKRRKWARKVSIGIGVLLLFGFPVGTIVGVALLICMLRKGWNTNLQ